MPVVLETVFEEGWTRGDPSNKIFCVVFKDKNTQKVLFKYAAKLEDIYFWIQYFTELKTYDDKKLYEKKERNSIRKCGVKKSETSHN